MSGTFMGYERANGEIGIRNHLLNYSNCYLLQSGVQSNYEHGAGYSCDPHQHGCSQIGADKDRTFEVLAGTGKNPNVGAVIIISLGCEVVDPAALAEEIQKPENRLSSLIFKL